MKKSLHTLIAACVLALFAVGCGSKTTVDSAKLKSEFASVTGDAKSEADAAIAAIDSGDMRGAVNALGKLITFSNDLNQAQLTAVEEAFVLANVSVLESGSAASEAESKANKAALEQQAQGSQ